MSHPAQSSGLRTSRENETAALMTPTNKHIVRWWQRRSTAAFTDASVSSLNLRDDRQACPVIPDKITKSPPHLFYSVSAQWGSGKLTGEFNVTPHHCYRKTVARRPRSRSSSRSEGFGSEAELAAHRERDQERRGKNKNMLVKGGQHVSAVGGSRCAARLAEVMRPAWRGVRLMWRDQTNGGLRRITCSGIWHWLCVYAKKQNHHKCILFTVNVKHLSWERLIDEKGVLKHDL